jgi:LemA protein
MSLTAWIPAVLVLGIAAFAIALYNKLVGLRVRCDESWASIDAQLKRRADLIPNLVETVKGYAAHEKELFEEVTNARAKAISGGSVEERAAAEGMLTGALRSLFAVAEAYPELKANTNFLQLQESLSKIEDDIQMARRYYNAVVRDYNTAIETFPGNIFASLFGFTPRHYFEIEEADREPVKVSFE